MAKNTLEAIRKSSHDVCNTYQTFMPNNYTPLSVTMFKITRHRQQCQVYVSGVNSKLEHYVLSLQQLDSSRMNFIIIEKYIHTFL